MIQGRQSSMRSLLFAVVALGLSGRAFAQQAEPAPPPQPTETPTNPATVDPNAPPLVAPPAPTLANPAPVTAMAPEPPKTTFPTMAGPALRLSEIFSFRPGILLQLWASGTQDSLKKANGDDGGWAQNVYLRRARFFVGGGLGKDLSYFFLTETSNLGLGTATPDGGVTKNFTTFTVEDAFLDYKFNKNVSFQGGLMLIPFTRQTLQSSATYIPIDIAGVSATYINALQTSVIRDTGFQLKLNANDNRFEARVMVSGGVRNPDGAGRAPGKNDLRFTGYLQYNFLDGESGYVFNGQYFGRKKMAGVAVGLDYQKTGSDNPYFATSATAFASIPLHGGNAKTGDDELAGQVEYLHFHNGRIPQAQLGQQDDLMVEAIYYNKAAKLGVFGKFEGRFFDSDKSIAPGVGLDVQDTRLYGGGLKYFLAEAYANLCLQYSLTQFPNQPTTGPGARNSANAIQLQLQLTYF